MQREDAGELSALGLSPQELTDFRLDAPATGDRYHPAPDRGLTEMSYRVDRLTVSRK